MHIVTYLALIFPLFVVGSSKLELDLKLLLRSLTNNYFSLAKLFIQYSVKSFKSPYALSAKIAITDCEL